MGAGRDVRESGGIPTANAAVRGLGGIVTMGKLQREVSGEHVLLESRLAFHLRCLREDATDPEMSTLERLALFPRAERGRPWTSMREGGLGGRRRQGLCLTTLSKQG